MDNLKGIVKKGWHPEKEGTTLKGQVSSLMGRNKDSSYDRSSHASRPLTELKDPSSFAPPPRRTGNAPPPPPPPSAPSGQRKVVPAPSKLYDPRAPSAAPEQAQYHQDQGQEYVDEVPSRQYQMNTTGLRTDHLPPPPGRRDGADGRSPPMSHGGSAAGSASRPAPPSLPPRLPPRAGSNSSTSTTNAASSNQLEGNLNQRAVSRLGAAGVSVPGLGIGRSSPAQTSSAGSLPPPRPTAEPKSSFSSQVGELQNRFSSMRTSSNTSNAASTTPPPAPGQGTTWEQKQSALKTASAFHKDPSKVSLSDAKAAASTANNFRQRHGEQVQAGYKRANDLNQKYGIMDKVGSYTGRLKDQTSSVSGADAQVQGAKKKPPPPPPKKKPGIGGSSEVQGARGSDPDVPPPIPMSTRPNF